MYDSDCDNPDREPGEKCAVNRDTVERFWKSSTQWYKAIYRTVDFDNYSKDPFNYVDVLLNAGMQREKQNQVYFFEQEHHEFDDYNKLLWGGPDKYTFSHLKLKE